MSQILDAINKAENERRRRAEQASKADKAQLYKTITQQQQAQTKRSKQRLLLLSLLLAGGVAYWLYQQKSSPQAQLSDKTVMPAEVSKTATKITTVMVANNQPDPAVQQTAPAIQKKTIAIQTQTQTNTNQSISESEQTTAVETEKKPAAKLMPLTQIVQSEKSDNKKAPLAALKPIAKKTKPQTAKKPIKPVQQKSPPKPTTASKKKPQSALKKGFNITAIVYDDNPSARLIFVNGGVVREGGVIPNSTTKVVSILKKGVVINDGNGEVLIGTR